MEVSRRIRRLEDGEIWIWIRVMEAKFVKPEILLLDQANPTSGSALSYRVTK